MGCETSTVRFPFGSQPSEYTQVQFKVPVSSGTGVTTLGAAYTAGNALIQVNDQAGCQANGRMYLLDIANSFADVVTILECNVLDGGVSKVRMANPLPANSLPITTAAAFFTVTPCPAESSSECFTNEGLVHVEGKSSPMPLAQIQEGDRVLDGALYTDVIGFLHEVGSTGKVVCIEHAAGEVRASPLHLLFARDGEKEAKHIEVGDELLVSPGHFAEVLAIRTDKTLGFTAPLTASGSITVDGATASNYATVKGLPLSHASMHAAFFPARVAATLLDKLPIVPAGKAAEKTNTEVHHPLVDLYVGVLKLDDVLSFLQ